MAPIYGHRYPARRDSQDFLYSYNGEAHRFVLKRTPTRPRSQYRRHAPYSDDLFRNDTLSLLGPRKRSRLSFYFYRDALCGRAENLLVSYRLFRLCDSFALHLEQFSLRQPAKPHNCCFRSAKRRSDWTRHNLAGQSVKGCYSLRRDSRSGPRQRSDDSGGSSSETENGLLFLRRRRRAGLRGLPCYRYSPRRYHYPLRLRRV